MEWTPLPAERIAELLQLCLKSTYFSYNGEFYEQRQGAAMGSPVSASNRLNRDGGYELPGCWTATMKKLVGQGQPRWRSTLCTQPHGRAIAVATPIRAPPFLHLASLLPWG